MGLLVSSALRMAKAMGMTPNFDMEDAEAYAWLTTGMEVMRMIRDGDARTNDDRARQVYSDLFTG